MVASSFSLRPDSSVLLNAIPIRLQHALGSFLTKHANEFYDHKKAIAELMRENWRRLSSALQDALGWYWGYLLVIRRVLTDF